MTASRAIDQAATRLGARLRDLRDQHTTLNVRTEIAHLDDRMIAIRATVSIDGQIVAQGHAAKVADQTGSFVAAAELLAVRQALLLGGFATDADLALANPDASAGSSPVVTERAGATPLPRTSPDSAPAAPPAKRQRATETASQPVSAADDSPAATNRHDAPTMPLATDSSAGANSASVPAPLPGAVPPVDAASDALRAATTPAADRAPVPRLQRPRKTQRASERDRETATVSSPDDTEDVGSAAASRTRATLPVSETPPAAAPPSVPVQASEAVPPPPTVASARQQPLAERRDSTTALPDAVTPAPPRSAAPRRSRSVPVGGATATTSASDLPPTQEQLRAAWRIGRPIPAWWPPERPLVAKQVTKAQSERLRALALDEEITPALLDVYSTMLFDRPVADLDQTQYAILEERLDRAYPSPLEETRARRLIYPIAVGDAMPIPPDRTIFIRWRDVPPVVEVAEPPKPAPPSWRTRGPRASGRRRP